MVEFNQSIQDPVSEDKHYCSTVGGRYVFPDFAGKVVGCIGVGSKSVSGEGGIECFGMDIRSKEFPPRVIIPQTPMGCSAVQCVYGLNQDI